MIGKLPSFLVITLLSFTLISGFKRVLRGTVYLGGVLMLSGCGTFFDGTSQTFLVDSNPAGAQCEISRRGEVLQKVTSTPDSVELSKSRHSIAILCRRTENETTLSGSATLQPILIGEEWELFKYLSFGLFWLIDATTAANRLYPTAVTIDLSSQ